MALKKALPKEAGEPVTKTTEDVAQEPSVVVEPVTQEPVAAVTDEPVTQEPEPVVTEEPAAAAAVEPVTQVAEPAVTESPEPVTQEPEPTVTEEPIAEEPEPEPEVEVSRSSILVEVLNLCDSYLQQPSTGIRIGASEVKELKADGWLQGQIDANLLKLV